MRHCTCVTVLSTTFSLGLLLQSNHATPPLRQPNFSDGYGSDIPELSDIRHDDLFPPHLLPSRSRGLTHRLRHPHPTYNLLPRSRCYSFGTTDVQIRPLSSSPSCRVCLTSRWLRSSPPPFSRNFYSKMDRSPNSWWAGHRYYPPNPPPSRSSESEGFRHCIVDIHLDFHQRFRSDSGFHTPYRRL